MCELFALSSRFPTTVREANGWSWMKRTQALSAAAAGSLTSRMSPSS